MTTNPSRTPHSIRDNSSQAKNLVLANGLQSRLIMVIFLLIVGFGSFVRLYQIGGQFVIDDEKHSIQALVWKSNTDILTHFSLPDKSDYCIPQTIFLKFVAEVFSLNEVNIRILSWIPGILLLFAPLLFRDFLNRRTFVYYSIFLAIHPLMVLYSRNARPYMIGSVLVCFSLYCFYRYCQTGFRKFIIWYSVTASIAIYFHIMTAPTVLTPQLLLLASKYFRILPVKREFRWSDILLSWMILGGLILVTMGPPLLNDFQCLLTKSTLTNVRLETIVKSIILLSGVKKPVWSLLVLTVLGTGLIRLGRRDRTLFMIVVIPFIFQIVSVMLLKPINIRYAFVFTRYISWEIPLLLLTAAVGFSNDGLRPSRYMIYNKIGLVIVTVWVTLNPIFGILFRHNNFIIPYAFERTVHLEKQYVPRIYFELAKIKKDFSIAEMPWEYHKHFNRWMDYQQIHRKDIYAVVGSAIDPNYRYDAWLKNKEGKNCLLRDKRLRFRKFVNLDDVMRNPLIRYVILHKSPNTEYRGIRMNESGNDIGVIRDRIEQLGLIPVYKGNLIEAYRKPPVKNIH